MRYSGGSVGRVFMARFDHGENVVDALAELCRREAVSAGWFFLLGAVARGSIVTGPREPTVPPEPVWTSLDLPHEIVGMGSVAMKDGTPSLHIHASFGRDGSVLTGCLRKEGEAYLVVEAMILEIAGVSAVRRPDAATGLALLSVE